MKVLYEEDVPTEVGRAVVDVQARDSVHASKSLCAARPAIVCVDGRSMLAYHDVCCASRPTRPDVLHVHKSVLVEIFEHPLRIVLRLDTMFVACVVFEVPTEIDGLVSQILNTCQRTECNTEHSAQSLRAEGMTCST